MIRIAGGTPDLHAEEARFNSLERAIAEQMSRSPEEYDFASPEEFQFEIGLRATTVRAALDLDRSGMDFSDFRESRRNPVYWDRTRNGGFELRQGAKPHEAIEDIFKNGSKYATECATAIMIIYYKALLDVLTPEQFDRAFPSITLMNWHNIDPILRPIGVMRRASEFLPGDRMYFVNPDVDPARPEWQGENVIVLGPDRYFGHGIGVMDADGIIRQLNENRAAGSRQSAYLLRRTGSPDYRSLMKIRDGRTR